jgi:RimJ/RimL family protein N-acetyltransferase
VIELVGEPALVGFVGLRPLPASPELELYYGLERSHWGRGLATEACRALVDIARTLELRQLEASHFIDNSASARVLDKLGFESTGLIAPRRNCARGADVPARLMRLRLVSTGNELGAEALAA